MAGVTIKGFIIAQILDLARQKMSAEDFAKLEKELGVEYRSLKLAFFKDYPVELQLKVEERVAPIVWNRTDDRAYYLFGRHNFETFAASAIGRATLALTGKDPKRIVKASLRMVSTVMNGTQIETTDVGPKELSFRFRNNPYRPLGWQGVIDATLEHAGVVPKVRIKNHGGVDTEYLISWEETKPA